MIIRQATPDDLSDILRMGSDFFAASGFAAIADADTLSMIETAEGLMKNEAAVLLVADIDGELVGMAGAVSYPFYFNREHLTGQELFWWVDPRHRSDGAGKALMEGIEAWARSIGMHSLMMVAIPSLEGESVGKLYQRAGFKPAEQNYIRRLDYGH